MKNNSHKACRRDMLKIISHTDSVSSVRRTGGNLIVSEHFCVISGETDPF